MTDLTPPDQFKIERGELRYPYWFAGIGLAAVIGLIVFLILNKISVTDTAALVGVFTTALGTLAGGVFGVKVGSTGSAAAIRSIRAAHAAALEGVEAAHAAAVKELQAAHTDALEEVRAQLDATVARVKTLHGEV